ncbi:MAG: FAD-dependent oxidoreductase [Planctomycetota bacterium]
MRQQDERYDLIVLGATMAGLSATLAGAAAGQRVLLVESGTLAGHEFVETLQAHRGWALPADAAAAVRALHLDAARRGIVADDRCDVAAFSCLLQEALAKSGAAALYMTDLTGLNAAGEALTVRLSNRSGIAAVLAARVIDATPEAIGLRAAQGVTADLPAAEWALRALLVAAEPAAAQSPAPGAEEAGLRLFPGRYPSDVIVELAGRGAAPGIGAARVMLMDAVARLRELPAWQNYSVGTAANEVAAAVRVQTDLACLNRLADHGYSAVGGWRDARLDGAPWAAFAAGEAAFQAAAALPAQAR